MIGFRFAAVLATSVVALTANASATTLAGGVYPFAVGDTFTYGYTETVIVENSSGTKTTPESYVQTTTIEAPITYDGTKAYPYQTTGTFTTSSGVTKIIDIEWRNFVARAGHLYNTLYGYSDVAVSTRPDNVILRTTLKRTLGAPFFFDILPEARSAWSLPVGYTESIDNHYETSLGHSNVLQEMKLQAADGSYRETSLEYDVPYTRQLNANGTGSESYGPAVGGVTWTFGLPQAGGSGFVIPATEFYDSKTHRNEVPDWYPGHHQPPHPLATNTMRDYGKQAAPKGCGKRGGTLATHIGFVYAGLDPVYGDTYDESEDYYVVPGIGRICRLDHIVETFYNAKVTGKVTSVTTTDSAEVLISQKVH